MNSVIVRDSIQRIISRARGNSPIVLLAALVANSGSVLSTMGIQTLGWMNHWELGLHQWWMGHAPIGADPSILLVQINRETPAKLGLSSRSLPLPRSIHAELLRRVREGGASTMVFDLLFLEESDPNEDNALREAIADSSSFPVVLATKEIRSIKDAAAEGGFRYEFASPAVLPTPNPSSLLIGSAKAFDPGHLVQGAILLIRDHRTGADIPHLSLCAVMGRYKIDRKDVRWDRVSDRVNAGRLSWPVGHDGEVLTRWTPNLDTFSRIELADALTLLRTAEGRTFFRDKIVLVGDVTGYDVHATPIGQISGMEYQAQTINTLLATVNAHGGRWRIPANILWCLFLGTLAAAGLGTGQLTVKRWAVPGILVIGAGIPGLSEMVLGLWVDTVAPCLTVVLVAGFCAARESGRATALVERYVPPRLRRDSRSEVTEEATVLFADLSGSTAMAEQIGPMAARDVLGSLLATISSAVTSCGGEVERTLGDGLMAVFRDGHPDHANRAMEAALRMQIEFRPLRERVLNEHDLSVRLWVGIESGMISGGMIKTGDREEWSSFGPTVNMAARLQNACRELDRPVLTGPGAKQMIGSTRRLSHIGAVVLKGISGQVDVFAPQADELAGKQ